ncbi:hypothetical protein DAEQUDRAFT_725878 [Daedalea quercina L-15889]|uniref:DUF6533 domain-containing protein n=1 Tax=Daedalea quercina L-15889 TaxID=1314783 RepID=A0A165QTK1_9APHY|nr:hypothetical protein DAEQUDRAFT_725878 [Daedalea quercina L-15889]
MSDSPASIIAEDRLLNYLVLSAQALCCYDYCITFASEVQFIWSKKFSLPVALFYAFRYPAVLNTLFIALGYFPWWSWQTQHSCVIIIRFEMAGDVLILTSSAVFTAMRVYALFHKSTTLFSVTLILGLIAPVISTYCFILSWPILYEITPGYSVCYIENAYVTNLWMMGARASSLVFDGFVLGFTWTATRRVATFGRSKIVLMRDTAVYFGFLFALNVLAIAIAAVHLTFIVVVNTWTAILTAVLLSRLMLDLRAAVIDVELIQAENSTSSSRNWTTSSFSRVLGSLIFTGRRQQEDVAIELASCGTSTVETYTVPGDGAEVHMS